MLRMSCNVDSQRFPWVFVPLSLFTTSQKVSFVVKTGDHFELKDGRRRKKKKDFWDFEEIQTLSTIYSKAGFNSQCKIVQSSSEAP